MANWLVFIKERCPILVYLIMNCGGALSGLLLGHGSFKLIPFFVSSIALMFFSFELRFMDEVKDYEKDVHAHPDRPLPRGLLSLSQVKKAITIVFVLMVIYGFLIAFLVNITSSILYLILCGLLFFMYKEFFAANCFEDHPFSASLSHQGATIVICLFCVAIGQPDKTFSLSAFCFAGIFLGSFFAYEVSRKLDPKAHRALKTYLIFYGPFKTFFIVLVSTVLAAVCAFILGLKYLLWPFEFLVLISVVFVFIKPEKYKIVEAIAAISLLAHIWAVFFQKII